MILTSHELDLDKIAQFLKSMANANRCAILIHLEKREYSVGELERMLNLSQSALSQHLARLRRDGLVKTRRDAQRIVYSIADRRVRILLEALKSL